MCRYLLKPTLGDDLAFNYSCARDLFDAARDASIDREAASRQLRNLDSRRFSTARRTDGMPSSHAPSDGTAASVAFLDFEAAAKRRISEDDALLRLAIGVLYGTDGMGGAASLLTPSHADVVFQRYVSAYTWDKAAAVCNVAPSTAKRMASELFDVVDAYGFERAVDGAGIAM